MPEEMYVGSIIAFVNGENRYEHSVVMCMATSQDEARGRHTKWAKIFYKNHYGHSVTAEKLSRLQEKLMDNITSDDNQI